MAHPQRIPSPARPVYTFVEGCWRFGDCFVIYIYIYIHIYIYIYLLFLQISKSDITYHPSDACLERFGNKGRFHQHVQLHQLIYRRNRILGFLMFSCCIFFRGGSTILVIIVHEEMMCHDVLVCFSSHHKKLPQSLHQISTHFFVPTPFDIPAETHW